ncbi:nucleoside hydrolase [Zavarzinella formosa]|uniref:nucleoside hydrolase n=1 Tax=Zavarzinella formosa TaxID=360055 RepID=UPI0002E59816|nr:nucleoside hydrolase [Zavarzinella formosa]
MPQKCIIIGDPGIDTAFAMSLALHDSTLDLLGLVATPGNVTAEQATKNVHLLINAVDPPKWPRLGAALSIDYEMDGTRLHGTDGLGNVGFPPVSLHQPTPGDKLIVELVRQHPHEVIILVLGPATMLQRAFDRDPELPSLIDRVIMMAGTWKEPGNYSATAEFHAACDPSSLRGVLRSAANITLIPLDVSRKLFFSPSDLLELPSPESATCRFLRKIVPYGIRASCNLYGSEGFHLKDVLGLVALARRELLTSERHFVDVELRGDLTRGMTVFDTRSTPAGKPNANVATSVDVVGVRDYITKILKTAG